LSFSLRRRLFVANTIDEAERIGTRPVKSEAPPAVQLAWPYRLAKTAPSLARRSMFGVGWTRPAPPPELQPKSSQPASSVVWASAEG